MRNKEDQLHQTDAFNEDAEEIIDEEELQMLRKMKTLKTDYREKFQSLKNVKEQF